MYKEFDDQIEELLNKLFDLDEYILNMRYRLYDMREKRWKEEIRRMLEERKE